MNKMRRGGGGGSRRPNPRPYASPTPLMSNQLGLKDIDLELELLKRKREIIEQQQQMLNNDYLSSNRFGEFSNLYEDTRVGYGQGGSGARKRPQVWEHETPPKRFATGNTSVPKSYSQHKPPFKKPNPQSGFQSRTSSHKTGPNPSIAKKKDFKPTKVSKPSIPAPPNKLSTYDQAERRSLISEMDSDSLILRADQPISNQLNGRLELALGHILKDMRARFPEYEDHFKNPKLIKQVLRERLRACMMGKKVSVYNETIRLYRLSYPPETDKDLLLNSLEMVLRTDFVPIESDDPQEYFTKNLGRLMTKKMDEMFSKLEEIYNTNKTVQKPKPKKSKSSDTNGDDVKEVDPNKSNDVNETNDDVQVISDQKNTEVYEIVDTDTEAEATDKGENDEKYKKIVSTEEYKRLDHLMTEMLPYMLRKITPQILKTMKLDVMYRKVFSGIKQDLRKKLQPDIEKQLPNKLPNLPKPIQKDDVINTEVIKNNEENKTEMKKLYQPLPYFVKILGRPSLPKRKCMQTFFDKFNPRSIKKHRTIHNILFVGFADKEDFDNILAASGTIIGRNTLTIKVSERSKQILPQNDDNQNSDNNLLINEELDEQISELLSSIKKSEGLLEDDNNDTNEGKSHQEVKEKETLQNKDVEMPENAAIDNTDQQNVECNKEVIAAGEDEVGHPEGISPEDNTITEGIAQSTDIKNEVIVKENDHEPQKDIENDIIDKENDKASQNDKEIAENPPENTEIVEEHDENNEIVENTVEPENKDTVAELKEVKEVKGTPTRSSPRLASTPNAIRTRRASKLASENNP